MISEIARLRGRVGHDPADGNLPGFVEDSWNRCLESYNLLPDVMRRPDMLTYHELQTTLERYEDLVHLAVPEIERLFRRLVDNEYMVSITSPDGVKLLFRCDHHFLGEMSAFGVLPGSIWSEEMQGTNGIGTCLKVGKPLSIIGDQHFNINVHALSCTVAPVLGRDGMIEGILNVTSSRPVDDKTSRLVRNIVERAALRIENRYFAHRNRHLRTLRLSHESDFSDMASEARIAFDDDNRIVDVSSTASSLLSQSRESLVGFDLGALMDFAQPLEEAKVTRTELQTHGGREIYATLLSESGGPRAPHRHSVPVSYAAASPATADAADKERLLLHQRLLEQLALAERMMAAHVPVLVQGETGVGKTTFARLLAQRCGHGERDIVVLNCASLTNGDEGLNRLDRLAHFTLILDHVEETPADAQSRLLQFLSDDHMLQMRNIGLISISGCDLGELVQNGRLRADLYYRLKGSIIDISPIRAMPSLDTQIQAVIADETAALGKLGLKLDEEARLILVNYHWPGNLRELRQAARHAAILAEGTTISVGHLPEQIVSQISHANLSARSQSVASRIEAALRHNGGNVSETARYLGISRATLYRKIQIGKIRIPEN